MTTTSPIGVFDSGVGGLTVYKALQSLLPNEHFVYLGDTARLPYGTKSPETVTQYALQAARVLMDLDIKLLVVACNTASALALPTLQKLLPHLPCLGVIDPGAREAAGATKVGHVAVLATEGTVRSGAYRDAILRFRPATEITALASNLLVALVEEGWCAGPEAELVLQRYLNELGHGYDTLVLGCTHFPLLMPLLRTMVRPDVRIIDGAAAAARAVEAYLSHQKLKSMTLECGMSRFFVTDSSQRFDRMAHAFLGRKVISEVISSSLTPFHSDVVSEGAFAKAI